MEEIYFGKPPTHIEEWIKSSKAPTGHTLAVSPSASWYQWHTESWLKAMWTDTSSTEHTTTLAPGSTIENATKATIGMNDSDGGVTVNGVFYTAPDSTSIVLDGQPFYTLATFDPMEEDLTITSYYANECLLEGTGILLANGNTKRIEDITYDDEVKVWDFDNGIEGTSKPLVIKKPETIGNIYFKATFASGKTLDIVSGHRVFSLTKGAFKYASECVGDDISTIDGVDKLVSYDAVLVDKSNMPKFYNVITKSNFNLYANGILTSCRLSNMHPVSEMKYINIGAAKLSYSDFSDVLSEQQFDDFRVAEQSYEKDTLKTYFKRLIANAI